MFRGCDGSRGVREHCLCWWEWPVWVVEREHTGEGPSAMIRIAS